MKVLCIEENGDENSYKDPSLNVVVNEVYTVVRESPYSINKYGAVEAIPVYILEERPKEVGYATTRFIPLSNIDETEMEREYTKELIEQ